VVKREMIPRSRVRSGISRLGNGTGQGVQGSELRAWGTGLGAQGSGEERDLVE